MSKMLRAGGREMTDYKELYLKMFRASEKAINIMMEAQRECEELYCEELGDQEKREREE